MLDDPGDFASHIGTDNRRRKLGMVGWGKIARDHELTPLQSFQYQRHHVQRALQIVGNV